MSQKPRSATESAILSRVHAVIGPRVRALAKRQRMTLDELAAQVGYTSRSSLYALLDGPTEPGITQVVRLAAALDLCSIEELFGPAGSVRLVGEALEDSPEAKHKPGV